jgi:hypothetical protein
LLTITDLAMETIIQAKSSSGRSSYKVWFTWKENTLSVFCGCKAGELGKFCKHKWRLLSGDEEMLYDDTEASLLAKVNKWVALSAFSELYDRVNTLERQIVILQVEVAAEKKILEKEVQNGLKAGLQDAVEWIAETDFDQLASKVNTLENRITVTRLKLKTEKRIVEMRMKNGF